jgi:hypothetical protein
MNQIKPDIEYPKIRTSIFLKLWLFQLLARCIFYQSAVFYGITNAHVRVIVQRTYTKAWGSSLLQSDAAFFFVRVQRIRDSSIVWERQIKREPASDALLSS